MAGPRPAKTKGIANRPSVTLIGRITVGCGRFAVELITEFASYLIVACALMFVLAIIALIFGMLFHLSPADLFRALTYRFFS